MFLINHARTTLIVAQFKKESIYFFENFNNHVLKKETQVKNKNVCKK